ncbi:DUF788 domain-containing protein [uncultured Methanobrevibacter sp.]|uniref:DUF788 domain-containing protein n=1 Tax=uncultured Methanobrevibacter sp. TaxID=253161 RepID=UPI00261C39AE|nr:DUF788 domain-containing protein [uncultured Methanobrevibacter sp.]
MNVQKIVSCILLVVSTLAILCALLTNSSDWVVYVIAILCIPFWILGLGFLTMAKPRKDDEAERIKEPFTGY